ncbi:MAG: hypothetical protein ABIH68_01450 [bacterium]
MKNYYKVVFAVLSVFLLSTALFAVPKKVDSSSRKKPQWISIPPEEKGFHYFIGISQNQEDKGVALGKALEEAQKQVLSTIGIVVGTKMRLNKEISENETVTKMMDQYRETGKAKLQGQKVKEIYSEEYRDGDRRFFDVYVLLKYSAGEIKAERERIEQQQAANRRDAKEKLLLIDKMISDGKIWDAYQEASRIFTGLADQPGASEYRLLLNIVKKIVNGLVVTPVSVKGKDPSVKLTLIWDKEKLPVASVKMLSEIVQGEGEIVSPQTSGDDGIAVFPISKIKFQGGLAKLKIQPQTEPFLDSLKNAYMDDSDFDSLKKSLENSVVSIILKASDFGGQKFCLIVWNEAGKREHSFEVSTTKELGKAGISVRSFSEIPQEVSFDSFENEKFYDFLSSQEMDALIVGRLNVIDNGDVYNLRSVTSRIDLKVIEIKTRKILAAFEKEQTGVQINLERAKSKTFSDLVGLIAPQLIDIAGVQ